jgi:hypothetical protein
VLKQREGLSDDQFALEAELVQSDLDRLRIILED